MILPPLPPVITAPTMGGIDCAGTKHAIAWTGGQPSDDWLGLEDPLAGMFSPNCARPSIHSERTKAYNFRIAPPPVLFKKDAGIFNLTRFAEKVYDHVTDTGMDTVFYVVRPDRSKVVNVIQHFDQVNLDHVIDEATDLATYHDAYDKENDRTARKYLENMLDLDMREELSLQQQPADGAAVTFMRILRMVADGSQQRFLRRKDELKALSPTKEPGENVLAYCTKARRICKELEQAHQWDWILITAILRALTSVSVERFRTVFYPMALAIDAALSAIAYLSSKEDQNEYMVTRKFHYTDIFTIAETTYRNILDNDDWGPSKTLKDSQQAPSAFLASMDSDQMSAFLASLNMDSVQFHALVQSSAANQTCHNCLNPGHIARNCKTPVATTPRAGSTPTSTSTPSSGSTTARGITGWRSVPPAPGEPSTQSKNGRTFSWCTKCNRTKGAWTATHTDATHVVRAQPATTSAPSPSPSATTPSAGAHLATTGDGLGIYQF
jgi:hypothetical protein